MRIQVLKALGVCALLIATFTPASAFNKYKLNPSTVVPAASGTINVNKDKNGNISVELKVEHLAKPENLTPPQTTYVVWIQTAGSNPENQGQMKVDKKLHGEFKTPTSYKAFQLFVTGETNPNATAPSGPEVLRQQINE